MKVKLISAKLKTGFVSEKTKTDRRFKKGYRVISKGYSTYELKLKCTNPNGGLKMANSVSTPWGQFMVVKLNFLPIDGEAELIQLMACEIGNDFEFLPEFDVVLLAETFGEGSI